jgi:hypothetical protein
VLIIEHVEGVAAVAQDRERLPAGSEELGAHGDHPVSVVVLKAHVGEHPVEPIVLLGGVTEHVEAG